ncbi:unnamed protein product, partial [Didymodactylos carnosus]
MYFSLGLICLRPTICSLAWPGLSVECILSTVVEKEPVMNCIYIEPIPEHTEQNAIKQLFPKSTKIEIFSPQSKTPGDMRTGHALVTFADTAKAAAAMEEGTTLTLNNRQLKLSYCTKQKITESRVSEHCTQTLFNQQISNINKEEDFLSNEQCSDNIRDIEKLKHTVLIGNVHEKVPNLNRIIRLFISSTFKDMSDERDKIMHVIYPKLEKYCSSKGYILQIVDMRWGIFDSAANEQLTTDICLDEVKLARELSNGPFFIAILSHRYGSKFPPRSIPEYEFNILLEQCDQNGKNLLNKWYKVDKNNVPPLYILKSVEEGELKTQWNNTDYKLVSNLLYNKAQAANLDEDTLMKYTRSVTELEIKEGIFNTKDYNFRCLVFLRKINDFDQLKSETVDPSSIHIFKKYVDMDRDTNNIDLASQQMINNLKERLARKLQKRNVKHLSVEIDYKPDVIQNDMMDEKFRNYLDEFSESFEKTVVNLVEANLNRNQILFYVLENYADLFHHIRFCQDKVKGFTGRNLFINQIKSLLVDDNSQYIVIHGISGSGKTSLIAKVAEKVKDWFSNINFVLVLRFIGTSEDSYNIQNLLSSIIKQLAHRFNLIINYEEMSPIDKLYNYFKIF